METLSTIGGMLGSVAVIIAAVVATFQINAWRREHVGKKRAELAEETLALFYEAQDAINAARSILGFPQDSDDAAKMTGDTNRGRSESQDVLLVTGRLHQRQDLFSRIRALRFRFAAVFGKTQAKPFYDLVNLCIAVTSAEKSLVRLQRALERPNAPARFSQKLEEADACVYGGDVESDPTTLALAEIVEQVESICQPEIQGNRLTDGGGV